MRVNLRWVATLFVVLISSLTLLAQDTGQITGTVHDSSGAAVANAKVTVSNRSQGIERPTVTNSTGDWLVGGLPGGTYSVTVDAPGFKKFQAKDIALRIGQKLRQDATLQVGATATEITVQGSAVAPGDPVFGPGRHGYGQGNHTVTVEWTQLHPASYSGSRREQPDRA